MKKIIFAAILAAFLVFMSGCGAEKKIKPSLPVGNKVEDIPNYVIEGFKLMSTDKGKKEWEIEGRNAQVFEMKKKIFVQNFKMKTFEQNGAFSTTTGKRAEIQTDTNFMEVNDNVRYTASNGMVLKTEKLFWDNEQKKIYTDEQVIIIKGQSVLKGIGFESDASMQNMIIKKQVRLTARDMQEAGIK
jgi:LPS export ABC transporter protein LptC